MKIECGFCNKKKRVNFIAYVRPSKEENIPFSNGFDTVCFICAKKEFKELIKNIKVERKNERSVSWWNKNVFKNQNHSWESADLERIYFLSGIILEMD